jgi:hypothetical protein
MRKDFVVAFALIGFGTFSPASAEPPSVVGLCVYAAVRCTNNCVDDNSRSACVDRCAAGINTCVKNNAQIQIRGFSKGSAGGNLKDFPSGASGATTGPNSHAVGATTNGMSATPGAATATTPAAISSTNGGAVTNSGTISTANNGSAVTNSGVNSGRNGVAGGGSGLLSRPGMPRLKAQ